MSKFMIFILIFSIITTFKLYSQDSCGTVIPEGTTSEEVSPYGSITNLSLYKPTTMSSPLRLFIHVVRYSDGTGGISQSDIDEAIQNLNDDFYNAEMQFFKFET